MSARDDGAIRVPIEIKTEDIAEIQDLIQKLSEAEGDITRIKSTGITSGSSPQTFGGQARRAGGERVTTEGRGGIFAKQDGEDSLPMSFRDRTGRQAMQRGNRFTDLEKQVNELANEQMQETMNLMDQMMGMAAGYIPFIGGGKLAALAQQKIGNKIKQKAGGMTVPAGQAAGGFVVPAAGGVRAGALMTKIGSIAKFAGPIGAIIGAVVGVIMTTKAITDWLQGPGGFWDIRYKRKINQEMDPFLERREKQEINIGLRTVRVTSSPAVRGNNQVFSTHEAVKKGIPIYNGEFEAFSKGLYIVMVSYIWRDAKQIHLGF